MSRIRATLLATASLLSLSTLSMPAGAALVGRLPVTPSGSDYQAYYDTVLNITWLADANLAASVTFGVAGISSTAPQQGWMSWTTAGSWIAAMNAAGYLGANTWRMPTMIDINNDGCVDRFAVVGTDCGYNVVRTANPNYSEMASMFYDTLGNLAFFDTSGFSPVPGYGLANTGPFTNLVNNLYWTGLTVVNSPTNAWYFGMPSGGQGPRLKTNLQPVWAVLDGDIAAVPVPGAAALFASALGVFGWARRRSAAA